MGHPAAGVSLLVLPDAEAVARAGADRFVESARHAIADHGRFRVALSGGSTPKAVYPLLVSPPRVDQVDWGRVEFFWGDERAVPPDHPDSNFGVAYHLLLSQLPAVRRDAIHRMPAELPDLNAAALAYEADVRLAFGVRDAEVPRFDLIWLGMGADGHTASLFPGSAGLEVTDRLVIANHAPSLGAWRMTFTFPLINAARQVLFVVNGADKATVLRDVLAGRGDLPAARVRAERTEFLVDAAAAAEVAAA